MRPQVYYAYSNRNQVVLDFLASEPVDTHLVYTGGHPHDYSKWLLGMWERAETFVLVEHDVLPYPGAIQEIWDCEEAFCGKPYRIAHFNAACFGCTKFSHELMTEYPDAMKTARQFGRQWHTLDHRLADALRNSGRRGGINPGDNTMGWPHYHGPLVTHLKDFT